MPMKEKDLFVVEEADFNPNQPDFSSELKVLQVALENEIRGRDLYAEYAKTVRNEFAKRVFSYLAEEELDHIEDIKRFIKSISYGPAVDVERILKSGSPVEARRFFGKTIKALRQMVKPTDDDDKARQVAMQIERAGYEYYQQAAKHAKGGELKRFFAWLVGQEQSHYILIRNAYEYANDPEAWNAAEEHWLLEG